MTPGCPCRVTRAACEPFFVEKVVINADDAVFSIGPEVRLSACVIPANQQAGKIVREARGWLHALSGPALSTGGTRQVMTGTTLGRWKEPGTLVLGAEMVQRRLGG